MKKMTTDTESLQYPFNLLTTLETYDLFDDLKDLRTGYSDEDTLDIAGLISVQKRMGGYGDGESLW